MCLFALLLNWSSCYLHFHEHNWILCALNVLAGLSASAEATLLPLILHRLEYFIVKLF